MHHYITNIVSQSEAIRNRDPVFSEAGYNRMMFIAEAINEDLCMVSMGPGNKKGFFKKAIESFSPRIRIVYLPQWHITFFKKKLRHIFYSFFLFWYLVTNVKRNDKLIIYNVQKMFFMIMPILVFKFFRKIKYILEIEELYSYKRKNNKLNFSETVSIKYASGYIIVNNNIQKFISNNRPTLLNAGYYCYENIPAPDFDVKNNWQIIYSGRLDDLSGVEIFLEALRFIEVKCNVIITGVGAIEAYVNSFKNINPLIDFKFLGILNKQRYYQMLRNSQIAVNPISLKYGFSDVSFPSKILQYLSFGLIVVSSNIEALNILDQLKKYIYTYNNDSPQQLAQQINILLKRDRVNPELIKVETRQYFDDSRKQVEMFVKNI